MIRFGISSNKNKYVNGEGESQDKKYITSLPNINIFKRDCSMIPRLVKMWNLNLLILLSRRSPTKFLRIDSLYLRVKGQIPVKILNREAVELKKINIFILTSGHKAKINSSEDKRLNEVLEAISHIYLSKVSVMKGG